MQPTAKLIKKKTPQAFVWLDRLCAVHAFSPLVDCRRAFLRSVLAVSLDELYDGVMGQGLSYPAPAVRSGQAATDPDLREHEQFDPRYKVGPWYSADDCIPCVAVSFVLY